jgi:hypothetical protein
VARLLGRERNPHQHTPRAHAPALIGYTTKRDATKHTPSASPPQSTARFRTLDGIVRIHRSGQTKIKSKYCDSRQA